MSTLTPGQEMLAQGFALQLEVYGHTITSGTNTFPALMTPVSPVDLAMMEMFEDKREVSVMTVLETDLPAGVVAQSTVTDENGQAWVVMQRNANPSQICTEFWVQKVTDKDH